ncbi:COG1361 family protein [Natrialbaceae archaeon A-gly3]
MSNQYTQVGSFEIGRVDAVGVGEETIAVGSNERLELVRGSERIEIDHGVPVIDVAVGDRIAVLATDGLTTYSRDGDRLWNRPAEDAHAIAASPDGELVGVVEPSRLRGVELGSGQERFVTERARPGSPDDDELLGTSSGFAIATWSFLASVDDDGEYEFDRNLEAVVRSVGCCEETLVVALQSDQLVCLDAETGDLRWRTELEATHVAPVGTTTVLVSTVDGVRKVGVEGTVDSVRDLSDGDVYATTDGGMVCTVSDGTVTTYVHGSNQLELTVRSQVVGVGSTVAVEVTNPTDREQRVSVEADLEGTTLAPDSRTVSVEGGGSALIDFPVESVRAEGEATLTLSVDGTEVERAALSIEDAATGSLAVETSLEPTTIDNGTAELTVTVENRGGVALDGVCLLEPGEEAETVAPGESWSGTITRPYEAGQRVSTGLEVQRGDRTRQYAPTCTLPAAPTIDVDPGEDALQITVDTDPDVSLSDRLVVELPGAGRVRSPVTIGGGELLLVVPRLEDGPARIGFENLEVEKRVTITGSGPFVSPGSSTRTSRHSRHSRADHEHETEKNRSGYASTSGDDVGTGREPKSGPRDRDDWNSSTESQTPSLSVFRDLEEPVTVGHAVEDRIVIENEGERVSGVTVRADGQSVDVGTIETGDSATLSRSIGVLSEKEASLPEVTIESDGGALERLPEQRVDTTERGLVIDATVDPADGRLLAELENGGQRDCRLRGVRLGDTTRSLEEGLRTGESTTVEATFDGTTRHHEDVRRASFAVQYADGSEETIEALIPAGASTRPSNGDPVLVPEISEETQVAGEFGTAVLVFENTSDRPLSDVVVSAAGEPINETFYTEARRERLQPEDWIEHFVDLDATDGEVTFEATVQYTVDDTEQEYTLSASGPATVSTEAWTEDHRQAWSIELPESGSESTRSDGPDVATLPYRLEDQ